MNIYEAVIGLEVHVQIRTSAKMFCSCPNVYGAPPNTLVCPICMGFPGVLPVPNWEAVRKTVMAGLMASCEISHYSKFDRKSYFYPDMPKNYQISQYDMPLCLRGKIKIGGKGFSGEKLEDKTIGITRIHLEEDVGKSTHFSGFSGIDFNRAGVPLMEIVSEPDMRTPDEAYAYLSALKEIMQYGNISDCDMEKGQMRCDVNVSIRKKGETAFGTKIEIKNLNSFRAVHRALEYEIQRQIEVIATGKTLQQETRAWNDDEGITFLLRSKESAHDYRYFPEPDMMPMVFTDSEIEKIRSSLPELPSAKRARFVSDYGITPYDAEILTSDKTLADYFDAGAKKSKNPKQFANWIISELLRELSDRKISPSDNPLPCEYLVELVELVVNGTISGKTAKEIFVEIFEQPRHPSDIVREKGLVQVSDESAIRAIVEKVVSSNPAQVEQYKAGKTNVFQFFVGQVMKESRGKANPQIVSKILNELLK
ncbi:MAG: Asp-tRNA(Asn)/Glu-tRNA(Gln) amidotransferase subunit GatB [Candidatus Nanoarchaeia archaeon]